VRQAKIDPFNSSEGYRNNDEGAIKPAGNLLDNIARRDA
jgi:hypothetical protein